MMNSTARIIISVHKYVTWNKLSGTRMQKDTPEFTGDPCQSENQQKK